MQQEKSNTTWQKRQDIIKINYVFISYTKCFIKFAIDNKYIMIYNEFIAFKISNLN